MTDYTKLVEALRLCQKDDGCELCAYKKDILQKFCWLNAMSDAAAAIEELLSFAHYVANKVTMSDEDWEDYHEAFTEVACRKLVKLGVISIEDDMYVYRQDEPQDEKDKILEDLRNAPVGPIEPMRIELLPKRGEWIWKHRHHGGFKTAKGKCECGRDVYAQIDERYETDDPYCPFCGVMNDSIHLNYCPNCGAKMEVQDGANREI